VLLEHGAQTKIAGTTLWKEMFLIIYWRKPEKRLFHARAAISLKDRLLMYCMIPVLNAYWIALIQSVMLV